MMFLRSSVSASLQHVQRSFGASLHCSSSTGIIITKDGNRNSPAQPQSLPLFPTPRRIFRKTNRNTPPRQPFSSSAAAHFNSANPSRGKPTPSDDPPPEVADDFYISTATSNESLALPSHFPPQIHHHLRQILWNFRAPIRYAFAYGSGVFSQGTGSSSGTTKDSDGPPMIDLIFGVSYAQHWHSINLSQHRPHYSFLGNFGSAVVARMQEDFGAGVYFNPYVNINGILVKYGITTLTNLHRDLTTWETLYLSGRLHKPVHLLRDHPLISHAHSHNLLSALRTALLLLPENFTEMDLYTAIARISYTGDPRMSTFTENPNKVSNIVSNQVLRFRELYAPLVDVLPNIQILGPGGRIGEGLSLAGGLWDKDPRDTKLTQDMSPIRRGNMVRRLPSAFRDKLYLQYQARYRIPRGEFRTMVGMSDDYERLAKRTGGEFEQRIAADEPEKLAQEVGRALKKTISWASSVQSVKGVATAGVGKSLRYLGEKIMKWKEAKKSGTTTVRADGSGNGSASGTGTPGGAKKKGV